jgi:hypothetical protein
MTDLDKMCEVQLTENFKRFNQLHRECRLRINPNGAGWFYYKNDKVVLFPMETIKLIQNIHLLEGCQAR